MEAQRVSPLGGVLAVMGHVVCAYFHFLAPREYRYLKSWYLQASELNPFVTVARILMAFRLCLPNITPMPKRLSDTKDKWCEKHRHKLALPSQVELQSRSRILPCQYTPLNEQNITSN